MAQVGVDEAGKGPVLGSMFAAAVRVADGVDLPDGLADSKQLSPETRERLDEALRATDGLDVALAEVPVAVIDAPDRNMNQLTVDAQAEALTGVAQPGDAARCDAADVDAGRFARRLAEAISREGLEDVEVRAEHRADERHAEVSAAGIVAKVARDAHVEVLAAEYGDLGSGYPSDPATRRFLAAHVERHGELPACARASWATSRDVLAAAEQAALDAF